MNLTVSRNLRPAMFSTAKLIANATKAVKTATRPTNVHFTMMYCRISVFFLVRQSSLNTSFSISLHTIVPIVSYNRKKERKMTYAP